MPGLDLCISKMQEERAAGRMLDVVNQHTRLHEVLRDEGTALERKVWFLNFLRFLDRCSVVHAFPHEAYVFRENSAAPHITAPLHVFYPSENPGIVLRANFPDAITAPTCLDALAAAPVENKVFWSGTPRNFLETVFAQDVVPEFES